MQVHAMGNGSYAAYLSGEELKIRNIDPDPLTEDGRERLMEIFSPQLQQSDGRSATLEVFPGRAGLLVFLRFGPVQPLFFAFDDLESLLDASGACGQSVPSSLIWMNGMYILALQPDREEGSAGFAEFGRRLQVSETFGDHLAEHGRTLIAENALEVLRSVFRV